MNIVVLISNNFCQKFISTLKKRFSTLLKFSFYLQSRAHVITRRHLWKIFPTTLSWKLRTIEKCTNEKFSHFPLREPVEAKVHCVRKEDKAFGRELFDEVDGRLKIFHHSRVWIQNFLHSHPFYWVYRHIHKSW